MHVGDAAVGDPSLGAVEHPLVLRLVVDRTAPQRAHVGARVGLAHAERGQLDLLGRAEALRHPLGHLLGRAVGEDARDAEGGAEDRQRDAGVAPGELLTDDRKQLARGVAEHVGHEVERVEPDVGGLLDDRPRRLLPLVPLVGRGAHHRLREIVHPLLDLELVLVEIERELGHRYATSTKRSGT